MATSLSGSDSVIINDRVLADFADTDIGHLTFPNDIAQVKTGKNGNSIYALNETGKQAELVLRIMRGSSDDKFLNALMVQQLANFAAFILMTGEFVKQIGDGLGNITADTYIMSGGIFQKQVEAKINVEGDIEQSVSLWHIKWTNAPRVLT